MAKIVDNNADGRLTLFWQRMDLIGQKVAGKMLPYLMKAADVIESLASGISNWMDDNPALSKILIGFAAALTAMAVAGGSLALVIAGLVAPFALLNFVSLPIAGIVLAIAAAIAAVSVAAYYIYENWSGIMAWWQEQLDGIYAVFDRISGFWNSLFGEDETATKTIKVKERIEDSPIYKRGLTARNLDQWSSQNQAGGNQRSATSSIASHSRSAGGVTDNSQIHLNLNVNGGDPAEVRRVVKSELDAHQRNREFRSRGLATAG